MTSALRYSHRTINAASSAASFSATLMAYEAARDAARDAAYEAARDAAYEVARDAIKENGDLDPAKIGPIAWNTAQLVVSMYFTRAAFDHEGVIPKIFKAVRSELKINNAKLPKNLAAWANFRDAWFCKKLSQESMLFLNPFINILNDIYSKINELETLHQ